VAVDQLNESDDTQVFSAAPPLPPKRKTKTLGAAGPPAKKVKCATRQSGTHLPDWRKNIDPNCPLSEL
jgi:hypothetical protein